MVSHAIVCPGLSIRLHPEGGRQNNVGQADIRHGQHLSPLAPHCGEPEQLLQLNTAAL